MRNRTSLPHNAAEVRRGVAERMARLPLSELEARIPPDSDHRPFSESLLGPGLSVVAEFKRLSPASGYWAEGVDLSARVRAYERGGAAAVSIATEACRYGGTIDDLQVARVATELPVMRRDCIVEPYQLYEGALRGADAVILDAGILQRAELTTLVSEAAGLDIDCLIEISSRHELEAALLLDVCAILINLRDPVSGAVEPGHVQSLLRAVPTGVTVMAEGGLSGKDQLLDLDRIGVDAVLVGEALMRQEDPESAVRELTLI